MKISQIKKGLILLIVASGTFAIGCELIVDFDRTKIPVEITEASIPDGATPAEGGGTDAGSDQQSADADAAATTDADAAADAADADADQ